MGSRMAANLQKAGQELVIYNRPREKDETIIVSGGCRCLTEKAIQNTELLV